MDASERAAYVKTLKIEINHLIGKQRKFGPNEYRTNRIKELSQRIGLKESEIDEMANEQAPEGVHPS